MPRKIISDGAGKMYSVTHADFLGIYQALGYAEIADEPDPVVNMPPATYPAVDDAGTWDDPPFYVITHSDGRQYAVTFDNFTNRYEALGFELDGVEGAATGGAPGLLVFMNPSASGLVALVA